MKWLDGTNNQLKFPPVVVNPANGNLALQFNLQDSGPFTPRPFLRYNVQSRSADVFGYGWKGAFRDKVQVVSMGDADLISAKGERYSYTNKGADGVYVSPAQTAVRLTDLGGGWMATESDLTRRYFDANGKLSRFQDVAGNRYTVAYDGSGNLSRITDPFARRTTYVYDGSGKSQADHRRRQPTDHVHRRWQRPTHAKSFLRAVRHRSAIRFVRSVDRSH